MFDKKLITLICEKCKNEYQISQRTYKNRQNKNLPNYCKKCMKIFTSENHSKVMKKRYENPEERKKAREATKKWLASMSEENKDRMRKNQLIGNHNYYSNLTQEEKNKHAQPLLKYLRNETVDEKEERCKKIAIATKRIHDQRSEEELKEYGKRISTKLIEFYKKETDEEKQHRSLLVKNGMANMSKEAKNQMIINQSIGKRKLWNDYSYDEKVKRDQKCCMSFNDHSSEITKSIINDKLKIDNNAENQFMMILLFNDINFISQYYNIYPYPKFQSLFPYNIQTGTSYVSPFHCWDFLIITEKTNIFIDIDGPIHNIKNECNKKNYINFNDSQRSYQTDNLPAYKILSYDNIVNADSKVINIYNESDVIDVAKLINLFKDYNN